jgi:Flp pilus assembly protein TadG/cytoskeletal protein CcmA (bactofilin family)
MIKELRKNQKGSVAAMVGVMLPVLAGFLGLALDVGNLVVIRTQMQNAVDSAVCAGCMQLSLPIPTGQALATTEAKAILTANNFVPANATVTFTQDTVKNSANAPETNCTLTNQVPTYFVKVFGIGTVTLSAYAEAIRVSALEKYPGGPFNYAVFSNTNLTINGTDQIQGSVHSNGFLTLNGTLGITQAAEGTTGVSVNGSNNLGSLGAGTLNEITVNGTNTIGSEYGGVPNIAMPDYTQQILDTPGITTYTTSQTFNGNLNVTGNMYVEGNVTINGTITETGAILATGNITVNGTSTISGTNQVFLYSSGGQITLNGAGGFGSGTSSVICYAPSSKGSITVNGVNTINGSVIGNSVTINGGEDIDDIQGHNTVPITSIDLGGHAQLIS